MCRFLAYQGAPIVLDELLFQPDHSLIKQSFKAREREEPLNGDGFGIGWYAREITSTPAVFRSISPAWNDRNLLSLSPRIRSDCFFAHVRAASVGDVSVANCHPFTANELLYMHNGLISQFSKIKRATQQTLSDEIFEGITGHTDSEHFFALILQELPSGAKGLSARELGDAVLGATKKLASLRKNAGISEYAHINIALTNGESLVATRYSSDAKTAPPPSLYYAYGEKVCCVGGQYEVVAADKKHDSVLVVSEKLNDQDSDWHKIPANQMLLVGKGTTLRLEELAI